MSYRRTKTFALYPDMFVIADTPIGMAPPYPCPEHKRDGRSVCFKCGGPFGDYRGTWYPINPILIKNEMPGTKQKILNIICYGMQRVGPLTTVSGVRNVISLKSNNDLIFTSQEIVKADFDWARNEIVVDKMIDYYTNLNITLKQGCGVLTGSYYSDIRDVAISCEYYTVEPPPTCDVKIDVKNRETGAGVPKAYVALMSGATVIADGYTDSGSITFHNVDEGSYVLRITAGGYDTLELAVDVKSPSVWYIARLVPIPSVPLPSWVIPAVVVVLVLGGTGVAYSVLKKPAPPTPPVIITR